MKCNNCYSELQRPGDYCLRCGNPNTDVVGIYLDDPVHVFCFFEGKYVGEETVKPVKSEDEGRKAQLAERNTLELVSEVIHRKRPERIIAQGIDPEALNRLWNAEIEYTEGLNSPAEFQKSVEEYLSTRGELERVDTRAREKIGGKHQTVIGGRDTMDLLKTLGGSPHVKKIIPGPIEASASRKSGEAGCRIHRSDERGNLKISVSKGSTVQEVRLVTTAYDKGTGERVIKELEKRLEKTG